MSRFVMMVMVALAVLGCMPNAVLAIGESDVELSRLCDEALGLKIRIGGLARPQGAVATLPGDSENPAALPARMLRGEAATDIAGTYEQAALRKGVTAHGATSRAVVKGKHGALAVEGRYGVAVTEPQSSNETQVVMQLGEVEFAAALNLGIIDLPGVNVGASVAVPWRTDYVNASFARQRLTGATVREQHDVKVGAYWEGGQHNWLAAGLIVGNEQSVVSLNSTAMESVNITDETGQGAVVTTPVTRTMREEANIWSVRTGMSALVLTPFLDDDHLPASRALRFSTDTEVTTLNVGGGEGDEDVTQHVTLDLLLPDAYNPVRGYLAPQLSASANTQGGWNTSAQVNLADFLLLGGTYGQREEVFAHNDNPKFFGVQANMQIKW